MPKVHLNTVEKIEILTLEDNYIDIAAMDNSDMVSRAIPLTGNLFGKSILAEHGFSAAVTTASGCRKRTFLMDFGLSEDVVIRNAEALDFDLSKIEAAFLSHGHVDHFGGLRRIGEKIGKKGIPLMVHPSAFKADRFVSAGPGFKIIMPAPQEAEAEKAGFAIVKQAEHCTVLDGDVLYLGEIPRLSDFEQGMPNAFFGQDGDEELDLLEDDTAVVMNLSGKGLVVLSGCAHSGIINTVNYAKEVTGISRVHAVMGGFHLTGRLFEPIIEDTVNALKEIAPEYIIPTHCTGRRAIGRIEEEMPGSFILNMAGTTITFSS
jgi:7,8-dihydropterin-6-yl-methyl-4-(beta-D-ribofuranosyl)aminobenzene 5'-phosphate synthase